MNKAVLYPIIIIIVLAVIGFLAVQYSDRAPEDSLDNVALNGEDGANAPAGPVVSGGCFVGGCSSQICSGEEGVVSTCEYRAEYACYQSGRCERQADGECGFTQTPELISCLLQNQ